ncbi:MAG: HAD-IIA family hydrolase [Thermoplasmata archaeon]|nr:HAD-IIA family hydrolase [Thermoplasmata archaeon]
MIRPDPDCRLCGLCNGRTQVVYPDGNPGKGIVFVGEGPGEKEDIQGRPFVGKSGGILEEMMHRHGFSRDDVMITNTVKCRPPDNRDPFPDEMAACRPFLESELAEARLVVGLGKSAIRDIMGYVGPMADIVNVPVTIEVAGREVVFIPTYHPTATIYNKKSRSELNETMRVVSQWIRPPMRFGGFMLDMDGTIYKGGAPIPGAREFISFLREQRIPFVFLTNNSSHARSFYSEKLGRLGFDASVDDILTSTTATIRFLISERFGKRVYAVATPDVAAEMENAGIELTDEDPDIVVLTFDTTITYEKINKAYRFLKGGAELIATHPDDLCPTEDSYDIDIGPFIRMFEQMCQTQAVVIGKPNRLMLEMAAREMGVPPSETVMVGDRLYTDIAMAARAGTQSILVLSGETDRAMLRESDTVPTAVADSVADIPSMVLGARRGRFRSPL